MLPRELPISRLPLGPAVCSEWGNAALHDHPFIAELSAVALPQLHTTARQCRFLPAHFSPALYPLFKIDYPFAGASVAAKRQAEFLAGRCAARLALQCAGLGSGVPARGEDGAPVWPAGVWGSISHSAGVALSAVSRDGFLGLDFEPLASPGIVADLSPMVADAGEWELLHTLPRQRAFTLVFSLKESLYKALYPQLRRYIDFREIRLLEVDLGRGEALCKPRSALALALEPGACFKAYWRWHNGGCLSYTRGL